MLDKLMQAQQKAGEVKQRTQNAITVSGSAEGGKITVSANGNKVIQSVAIDDDFFKDADKEQLEEFLVIASKQSFEQGRQCEAKAEMGATLAKRYASGGLGGTVLDG